MLSLTAGILAVIIFILLINGVFLWRLTRQTRLSLEKNADSVTADLRQTLHTLTTQNKELENARQDAVAANRIISDFLANMSHEIRTPINAMLGFTHLLLRTELSPNQTEYLTTIKQSANSVLKIFNDILDFAKLEAGKFTTELTPTDIRACVEEIVNNFKPMLQDKGLNLIATAEENVPPAVMADPMRIKQVVGHLLENAVKFTSKGGIVVRVFLEKETTTHAKIKVSVTDTGIGLSTEAQAKIFQPFHQEEGSNARRYSGTGLGLSLSQKIISHMGGEIGLDSKPNQGATFWFTLTCDKTNAPRIIPSTPVVSPPPPPPSPLALIKDTMKVHIKAQLLVVDDNPTNLKLMQAMLSGLGATVVTVNSAEEALLQVRETRFDLIFMDIQMPGMDGVDATRHIRQTKNLNTDIPVIAVTAHAVLSEKQHWLEAGINDYLPKPVSETQLITTLSKWVEKIPGCEELPLFDWDLSVELAASNSTLAKELLMLFLQELPVEQANINRAIAENKLREAAAAIHKLHGAACYVGVPRLKFAADTLEDLLKNEKKSSLKSTHIDSLNRTIEDTQQAIVLANVLTKDQIA